MLVHKFGIRLDGVLHVVFGCLAEDEFREATVDGLPPGMVAWHIDETELEPNTPSQKVVEIRKLPITKRPTGLTWAEFLEGIRRQTLTV